MPDEHAANHCPHRLGARMGGDARVIFGTSASAIVQKRNARRYAERVDASK